MIQFFAEILREIPDKFKIGGLFILCGFFLLLIKFGSKSKFNWLAGVGIGLILIGLGWCIFLPEEAKQKEINQPTTSVDTGGVTLPPSKTGTQSPTSSQANRAGSKGRPNLPSENPSVKPASAVHFRCDGIVKDLDTREPVVGALVSVQDFKTHTDSEGRFWIDVTRDQQAISVVLSHDAYKSTTVLLIRDASNQLVEMKLKHQ